MLEDYKLVFTIPGLPYVEPGFASVTRVRDDDGQRGAEGADRGADIPGDAATPGDPSLDRYEREVHGVAYVIADDDWRFVLRSESGYAVERVTLRRLVLELARSSGESGEIEESSDSLYESAAGAVPAAASSARAAAAATPIV